MDKQGTTPVQPWSYVDDLAPGRVNQPQLSRGQQPLTQIAVVLGWGFVLRQQRHCWWQVQQLPQRAWLNLPSGWVLKNPKVAPVAAAVPQGPGFAPAPGGHPEHPKTQRPWLLQAQGRQQRLPAPSPACDFWQWVAVWHATNFVPHGCHCRAWAAALHRMSLDFYRMALNLSRMPLALPQMPVAWSCVKKTPQWVQRLWRQFVARPTEPGQELAMGQPSWQTPAGLACLAPATWGPRTKRLEPRAGQTSRAIAAQRLPPLGAAQPWHQAPLSGWTVPATAMRATLRRQSPVALPQSAHQQTRRQLCRVALAQAAWLGWPFCPLVPALRSPKPPCQGWHGSGHQATSSLRVWPS